MKSAIFRKFANHPLVVLRYIRVVTQKITFLERFYNHGFD